MYAKDVPAGTIFYHGTKADLQVGDLMQPGFGSNYREHSLRHIYFSAAMESAVWGAELATGSGYGGVLGASGDLDSKQLLELQLQIQQENREFTTVSNVMKVRHDTAKATIQNIH